MKEKFEKKKWNGTLKMKNIITETKTQLVAPIRMAVVENN